MSKKQLLNESEIRRFMKLANLEPLTKAVVTEMAAVNQIPQDSRRPETGMQQEMMGNENEAEGLAMEAEDAMEVEVGDEADPEKQSAFEAAVKALADAMGIEVELEGAAGGEEDAGEEMPDLDMGGEEGGEESEEAPAEEEADKEEMDEAKKEEGEEELDEAKKEEDEEEKEESKALSEDSLVEAVLARVTARLVAEAKKKKMSAKEKMKMKAKEKKAEKKEVVEEATDSKGGGPLLSKGGNKHDVYKGHADMAYAKGKEGKGGHQMEDLPAKAEHTVTHGGKNLATLGGNKKKV
jgi:hypothetical protein